jgi:RNA polymerase sigma-70 factor (ECF subfamily)
MDFMTATTPAHGDEPDLAGLVARAKNGDAAAFDQLCRRCYDDVLWHFTAWMPGQAEDLTQKLFAGLAPKLDGYEESGRFRAWLRGVAYNMYRTQRRSEHRRLEETLRTAFDVQDSESTTMFRTAKQRLRELARNLPAALRDVWELHIQGLSHEEIAQQLGIRIGAVYTRLHRARALLIEWMSAGPRPM